MMGPFNSRAAWPQHLPADGSHPPQAWARGQAFTKGRASRLPASFRLLSWEPAQPCRIRSTEKFYLVLY